MNLNQLRDKLIAVAKKNPPGDQVPYAFEKRIMNRIEAAPAPDSWALWGGPLWRAAISCIAITVLCAAWSLSVKRPADSQETFSQSFEAAVTAPPSQHAEDAW
jgi:hypothetical protein